MRRFIITAEFTGGDEYDAQSAKEAVATALDALGHVRVLAVEEREPRKIRMVDGKYVYE